MGRKFGLAAIWFAAYYMITNIVSIVLTIIVALPPVQNAGGNVKPDVMMQIVMDAMAETAVLSLIISAIFIIIAYLVRKCMSKTLQPHRKTELSTVVFCIGAGLLLNAIISLLLSIVSTVLPDTWINSYNETTTMLVEKSPWWIVILGVGILAPIMEEITFRYGVHKNIAQGSVPLAFIVSSSLFGFIHGNIIQGTYATILGLILAWIYTKTDNLIYPITMHISINLSSAICMLSGVEEWKYLLALGILGVTLTIITSVASPKTRMLWTNPALITDAPIMPATIENDESKE